MNAPVLTLLRQCRTVWQSLQPLLQSATDLASLAARAYLAQVFFLSGLTKLRDWETTLLLFTEEYRVPLLSPEIAAVMGTGGELLLPVLLLLGLGGRAAALGLGVVNAVAVVSLPEIAPAALQQHITWGVLLAALLLYGLGRWSVDHVVWRRLLAPQAAGSGPR